MIRHSSLVFGLIVPYMAIATGCHQPAHTSPAAIAPDSLKELFLSPGRRSSRGLFCGMGTRSLPSLP